MMPQKKLIVIQTPPRQRRITVRGASGAVLLEVVLALALLGATVTIVSTGLHASMRSVQRLELTAAAENLAVTVMSEMRAGIRPVVATQAEPFAAPWDQWTLEVLVEPILDEQEEAPTSQQVQVVVRHLTDGITRRLGAWIKVPDEQSAGPDASGSPVSSEADPDA